MARPPSTIEKLTKWCRRNPAVASLSGLAVLLLTLVAVSTSIGFAKTNKALQSAREERTRTEIEKRRVEVEREKAEQTLGISLQALDRVYKRFAPERLGQQTASTIEGIDGEQLSISTPPMLSKETASLLEDVLSFYDQFAQQDSASLLLKKEAAKANRRVGDIHQQLGDYKKSTMAYMNAIAMYMKIGNSELELAKIETALGEVHRKLNERGNARQSFLNAVGLLEPLAASTTASEEAKFELARTLYLISKRRLHAPDQRFRNKPGGPPPDGPPRSRGDRRPPPPPPGARRGPHDGRPKGPKGSKGPNGPPMHPEDLAYLERAVAILEDLSRNDSAYPEYRFLLALCYREKEDFTPESGHTQSIGLLQKLCEQYPQIPQYRYELGVTLAEVPVHDFRDANISDSIDSLHLSLQHLNKLTRSHPNIPSYTESCAHTHHKLGSLLKRVAVESEDTPNEKLADSARHLRMAVRLQRTQCEQFPESKSERIWLARMRDNLANCLRLQNQLEPALSVIEESIAESSSFTNGDNSGNGNNVPAIHMLIVQHETRAEILDDLDRYEDAKIARREANDLREHLPPPPPKNSRR